MTTDDIIQEVWRAKDATAAKYNHDVTTMSKALRDRERLSSATVIDLHSRRHGAVRE